MQNNNLTETEQVVFEMMLAGKTNKDIATTMNKSPNTVKKQVGCIFLKLNVKSRAELAVQTNNIRLNYVGNKEKP